MMAFLRFRRELSLLALAGLLPLPGLTGCAPSGTQHIHDEYPEYSYQTFQEQLAGKDVAIHFGDGTVRSGKAVLINAKRISWLGAGQTERSQVATSEVWKLEATGGANAGAGAGMGLLIGAGLGAAVGAASYSEGDWGDKGESAAFGAIVFGLIGTVVGAVAGGSNNPTATYEINPDLAPPAPPQPEEDQEGEMFEDL